MTDPGTPMRRKVFTMGGGTFPHFSDHDLAAAGSVHLRSTPSHPDRSREIVFDSSLGGLRRRESAQLPGMFAKEVLPVGRVSFFDIPGIVPALATLTGIVIGFALNWLRDVRAEHGRTAALRKRFAASLLAELAVLDDRYREMIVARLVKWKENERLELGEPIQVTNFFPVFDGNTDKLGLLESVHAKTVIRAYLIAKAHPESLNVIRLALRNVPGHGTTAADSSLIRITNEAIPRLRKESAALLRAYDEANAALKKYV